MNENVNKCTSNTVATICGIVSLVVSILFGIMFGVIGAAIGIALGVVAIVFGIKAKKETDNVKGTAGFVCGILGIVFAVIFAVGCSVCGAGSAGYGCYGCVGGSCMVANDGADAINELNQDTLEELQDALKDLQ